MVINLRFMVSIHGDKAVGIFMNAHIVGKFYQATSAIAAHAAGVAVGIIIDHFKIITAFIIKHH